MKETMTVMMTDSKDPGKDGDSGDGNDNKIMLELMMTRMLRKMTIFLSRAMILMVLFMAIVMMTIIVIIV